MAWTPARADASVASSRHPGYDRGAMTLILTQSEVEALLPMETCMDLMADVLRALARGEAENPLRTALVLPDRSGVLGLMPGFVASPPILGLKVVGVFGANDGTELDSHQGMVSLFNEKTGVPLAIVEASAITAIRTAATSGVATRLLAREDAGDLALLGAGVQAQSHLAAMAVARKLRRVRVYSPRPESRRRFAELESAALGFPIEVMESAKAAVLGADLVCTTTSSREPVVEGAWLASGAHVNAAGSSIPTTRELDAEAVKRARMFVDRRESTVNEGGEYLFTLREGAIGEDHILGEIGDLLLERVAGRESEDDITLFKSLGLAVEDLAAARFVVDRALEQGVGTHVDLTGKKHGGAL